MKILVIVAHPNRASFNHAIAATCARVLGDHGHEVMALLLFDPSAEQPRLLLDGSQIEGQDQPTHWTLSQQRSATFVAVGVEWARAGRLYGGFACLIFVVWRILEGL